MKKIVAQASRLCVEKPKSPREKILALQFKCLGDAVLLTPAFRALHAHFPGLELHLLVPEGFAPLFQHSPRLARVWTIPRRHGRARWRETWPIIRQLRREKFDRSVDFGGNDRGALLSRFIGARRRLGRIAPDGFWGRKFCYTERERQPGDRRDLYEARHALQVLSAWGIAPDAAVDLELFSDPARDAAAAALVPSGAILGYVSTSRDKKLWPASHWAELYQRMRADGRTFLFATGLGTREQAVMAEISKQVPDAPVLPPLDLATFLAGLKRAAAVISGDTGPLHFAAGLGVPTVGLFGPTSPAQWAPVGARHLVLTGTACQCIGKQPACTASRPCMAAITPEQVVQTLAAIITGGTSSTSPH